MKINHFMYVCGNFRDVKLFLSIFLVFPIFCSAQLITTVAGNGTIGKSGDNGQATAAQIFYPSSIAIDQFGILYIADQYNFCARKVNLQGIITTCAGAPPLTGYGGDNGPATNAEMTEITGIATDDFGTIILADNGNKRIRQVNKAGTITTIAGNGSEDFYGDNGRALNAGLGNGPVCLYSDRAGNLYFSDNSCVRKINYAGVITTVAGKNEMSFSGDGGPATAASMKRPKGIALDPFGNLFIADYDDNRVRKVDRNGIISTFAGNGYASEPGFGSFYGDGGPATDAGLSGPTGIAVDGDGNVYIGDFNNHCVRKVDRNGIISTFAGTAVTGYSGDGGPATAATLLSAAGLAFDADGNLYICDAVNNRVRKVSHAGEPPVFFARRK